MSAGRGKGRPGKGGGRSSGKGGRPDKGAPGRSGAGRPGPRSGRTPHGGADREPHAEPQPDPQAEAHAREERRRADPRQVIYGRNPVYEALRSGRRRVHHVWATPPTLAEAEWLRDADVPVEAADAHWITRRAETDAHQGICALVDPYPYANVIELMEGPSPLIVALDEVQDPQNLGAIARTAEGAGANGLVIPGRRSAEVTPAAVKASAGAVEHLPIARVRNLADWLVEAKQSGAWIYGAAMGGGTRWTEVDWKGPVVLVLGAEGRGLRPRVAQNCDSLVALPLRGRVESLNVGAAAAALLFEAIRQRS
jgi:23S rRNA (guanosine2251-2'-O)-methyltransferase